MEKQVDKGKQNVTEAYIQEEIKHEKENLHETDMDFDLVDLSQKDDSNITSIAIK